MSNHARHRSLRNHPVTKVVGTTGTILSLGAALVAVSPGTAGAAEIQVTSAADDNGTGTTLREAIVAANLTDGVADVITFAPALNGQTITLAGALGEIQITDDLTVQGPGADLLTVAGSGDAGDRIFHITEAVENVTVSGLTFTDGHSSQGGGAIYSFATGAVTLTSLHVTGNQANGEGGGVVIWGNDTASATVTGSTFDHNDAGGNGGGLHVYNTGGPVLVTGNTFDQNHADDYGGGLSLYYLRGTATVTSTFTTNDASSGGGIAAHRNDEAVAITGSTIDSDNTAHYGGGVSVYGTDGGVTSVVTITGSTIADNAADESGGGVRVKGDDADVTIDHSTISGNYASVDGGGAYAYGSDLTIVSSTISGNEAQGDGGGVLFHDGEAGGVLDISHTTITDNIAGDGGGGVAVDGAATIDHTIIANQQNGGDLAIDGDEAVTLSNSLLSDPDPGVTDGGNNAFETDPVLGALANNGGPTQTHALLDGSPALNSGDPAFTPPPSTDQRGEPRVAFVVIDKGAYEAQPDEEQPRGEEPPAAQPVDQAPNFTG